MEYFLHIILKGNFCLYFYIYLQGRSEKCFSEHIEEPLLVTDIL